MKKYKIKLPFYCKRFCNNNFELWTNFFKELQLIPLLENEQITISGKTIMIKYRFNSPIKNIREIVNRYNKLYRKA